MPTNHVVEGETLTASPLTYALRCASFPQYIHVMDTVEGDATTEGTATHGTSSLTDGHQELGTVQKWP